jgi:type VI secretion system protein ImpA
MELERIAQGTPERVMGDSVQPAEEPDWSDVESRAEALFGRSKDLRVAVHLAQAALARHGLPGLAEGLDLIQQLLNRYWEGVHPRLDPEDDNDPTSRLNCLLPLADRTGFVAKIRATPLVSSQLLGRFSFRDYLIATGETQAAADPDAPLPDVAQIEGAFQEANVDDLSETNAALEAALAGVAGINDSMAERLGAVYAPDLDALHDTLRDMRKLVSERLLRRGVGEADIESGGGEGVVAAPRVVPGEIASREDVVAALERVCEYYKRHEPSSPVPFVLRRAQRLARMDFMEILRDMTPSGVSEAELISGVQADTGE